MGEKKCRDCGGVKPAAEFIKRSRSSDGLGSYCKVCGRRQWRERYLNYAAGIIKRTTKYRARRVAEGWDYPRKYAAQWREQHRGDLRTGLMSRLHDAQRRAQAKGWEFKLTMADVLNIFEKQQGRCPISGRELLLGKGREEINALSIDRMDNSEGYVPGNVRLTTWMVNMAMAHWGLDAFVSLCRDVVRMADDHRGT